MSENTLSPAGKQRYSNTSLEQKISEIGHIEEGKRKDLLYPHHLFPRWQSSVPSEPFLAMIFHTKQSLSWERVPRFPRCAGSCQREQPIQNTEVCSTMRAQLGLLEDNTRTWILLTSSQILSESPPASLWGPHLKIELIWPTGTPNTSCASPTHIPTLWPATVHAPICRWLVSRQRKEAWQCKFWEKKLHKLWIRHHPRESKQETVGTWLALQDKEKAQNLKNYHPPPTKQEVWSRHICKKVWGSLRILNRVVKNISLQKKGQ